MEFQAGQWDNGANAVLEHRVIHQDEVALAMTSSGSNPTPSPVSHEQALNEFWWHASQTTDFDTRLELLKHAATREIYPDPTTPSPKVVRQQWNAQERRKCPLPMKKCYACLKNAARDRHHIIPVANGGTNEKRNIVGLCPGCHTAIHPWLLELSYATHKRMRAKPHRKDRPTKNNLKRWARQRAGVLQAPRDMAPRLRKEAARTTDQAV